jgi:deoxyribose-phosphate aldolase
MTRYALPESERVDPVLVEERAASLAARALPSERDVAALDRILALTDLTTLAGTDSNASVRELCRRAKATAPGAPPVAAVCVFPAFVRTVSGELARSSVRVVSVAGAFPTGHASLEVRVLETRRAIEDGADEVDVVLRRGPFLAGEHALVFDELVALRAAAGAATLKVILETGELGGLEHVASACRLAIDAGSDFVKTSTGKIQPGATLPATLVMADVVRAHFDATGERIGLKVAGGIRTVADALRQVALVEEVLGAEWLTAARFRIGASSLVDDVLAHRARARP